MEVSVETSARTLRVRDCTILQLLKKNWCTYTEEGGLLAVCTNHKRVSQRMYSESTVQQVSPQMYMPSQSRSFIFPRIFVVSLLLYSFTPVVDLLREVAPLLLLMPRRL